MNVCKLMLSLLLVTASAVPLQTGSQSVASSKIDPGKEADIRRLLKLTGAEALVLQTMDGMEKDLKPLVKNSLPAGEYRDKLVDLFFARFQSKAKPGQMLDLAVPIYDSHFSAEEIKGLIQFYQTPLGQKAISTLPKLVTELTDAGRHWGEQLGRESMHEVLTEHPDLESALEDAAKAKP